MHDRRTDRTAVVIQSVADGFEPLPDSSILGPDPVCLLVDQLRAEGIEFSAGQVAKLRTVIERGFVLFRKNGQTPLDIPP
jgi:hypothetical protein